MPRPNARIAGLQRVAASNIQGEVGAERARRALAAIERRRLNRAWKYDPSIPGSTLRVDDRTLREIDRWLADQGVDIESVQHTSRCRDRVCWAAYLHHIKGTVTIEAARRRIFLARRDDERWRVKQAKLQTGQP
jgi:hypothetical protein